VAPERSSAGSPAAEYRATASSSPVPTAWTGAESVVPYPRELLDGIVLRQSARTPRAPAIQDGGSITTYAELIARARSLAIRLQRQQIGPGDLVAVCLDRCEAQLVSVLGVLMAGAAYVPIDPHGPAERREFMLNDSEPRAIVTNADGAPAIPARFRSKIVRAEDSNAAEAELPAVPRRPEDLAYVIYTSGSTGIPKGVLNQHDGITNHLAWMASAFPLSTNDRVLAKTSALFDVSVWEWFWPLSEGATVVLLMCAAQEDAGAMRRLMRTAGITTVHFVPSLLEPEVI